MKTKLIFLDIDGTLISAMDHPSILVKQAIQTARANGHKVFLCTGRNMPIIGDDILEIGFDGIIASAGSHIEIRSEEHTSELQSRFDLVCRLLLEKTNTS